MAETFDLKNLQGLSVDQAAARLRDEGPNDLPSARRRSFLWIVLEVVREPMFLLLVACGGVYLATGEVTDALLLLGFVVVVMGLTIFQERRSERALEALRDLSSPRAMVIRGGRKERIAGRDVVRGDLILLAEGDRVPADAAFLYAINVSVDESLLTGESAAVRKTAAPATPDAMGRPGGDDLPFVFSGTLITAGQGVAQVLATGPRTEIGRIGKALQTLQTEQTLLQKETGRLVKRLAAVGLGLCLVVVVVYGLSRGNTLEVWKEGLLAGIALAMATLPEEFPVVLTIFLALGAWRIARYRVLTRRVPVVETLGAATVLCVDKTGTLTQNQMAISQLNVGGRVFDADDPADPSEPLRGGSEPLRGGSPYPPRPESAQPDDPRGGYGDPPRSLSQPPRSLSSTPAARTLPETFHEILEYGILASKREPFDPMEKALKALGDRTLVETEHLHADWTLVHEYPLSPALLALSHVWKSPDGRDYVVAAKGAPEAVADLCHFTPGQAAELEQQVAAMAARGLRILGVAKGLVAATRLPDGQHDVQFQFLGLVGLADPVRPTVPAAIEECYRAGIRVIMITGDYTGTAQSIARQIGLHRPEEVITGVELDAMTDAELAERIGRTNIFARVVPQQKLRIVQALKAAGEVVAMTGDGVNDAPALKAAHIGIAMGGRGTDVAREAAGLVLLDDDFSSIVSAVRMGRRIFDNIRKAVSFIFAVHVPIAGLSMAPVFLADWLGLDPRELILMPIHILFLELIIDPACSVVFEAEAAEAGVMDRPPRRPDEPLFSLRSVALSVLQGLSVLAIVLGVFVLARHLEGGPGSTDNARALTFATLVIANLGLILTNRSWTRTILSMLRMPNQALWWVVGGALVFLFLAVEVPQLRGLFHFSGLHPMDWVLCAAAGAAGILWFEGMKWWSGRRGAGAPAKAGGY
jgi:P-type Ca2+ transporter type 2C